MIKIEDINIKLKLANLIRDKFSNVNILVVSGCSISNTIALQLFEDIDNVSVVKSEDDKLFIKSISSKINSTDVVIGVGGGTVVDISKEISFQSKAKLVLIPTVLTNDGLASGLVVLKSVNSGKSIYRKSADYILIDKNIIESSPKDFLLSSIGEVFSKYSSYNDWMQGKAMPNKDISSLMIQSLGVFSSSDYEELDVILSSIIKLGEAINLQGESSPASGSEHLLYHALKNNGMLQNTRHGIAVASISIFTLFLQDRLEANHIKVLNELGIETDFAKLESTNKIDFNYIFEYAKNYKKDRVTVLNSFTSSQLVEKYQDFKTELNNISWE